jgi:hypothetical protein
MPCPRIARMQIEVHFPTLLDKMRWLPGRGGAGITLPALECHCIRTPSLATAQYIEVVKELERSPYS